MLHLFGIECHPAALETGSESLFTSPAQPRLAVSLKQGGPADSFAGGAARFRIILCRTHTNTAVPLAVTISMPLFTPSTS